MPRFFVGTPLNPDDIMQLPDDVVRHILVLRLQPGDSIVLFNGEGGEYSAELVEVERRSAKVKIREFRPIEVEVPYHLTLAQGIASGDKMDWLIEKAIELGVRRVVPLVTVRSVVRLSGERAQRRAEHWRALASAACEQCGRNRVPQIDTPAPFERWLDGNGLPDGHLRLMLSPRAQGGLELLPEAAPAGPVELLIGPEGGLSADEETAALAAGYLPISLGSRILRTETAGLAMLAALATRWGGWYPSRSE